MTFRSRLTPLFTALATCLWAGLALAQAPLDKHLGPIAGFVELGTSGAWTAAADENWFTLSNAGDLGAIRYVWASQPDAEGRDFKLQSYAYTQPAEGDLSHAGLLFNFHAGDRYMAITIGSDGGGYIFVRTPDGLQSNRAENVRAKLDGSDLLSLEVIGGEVTTRLNGEVMFRIQIDPGPTRNMGVFAAGAGTAAFTGMGLQ